MMQCVSAWRTTRNRSVSYSMQESGHGAKEQEPTAAQEPARITSVRILLTRQYEVDPGMPIRSDPARVHPTFWWESNPLSMRSAGRPITMEYSARSNAND